MVRSDGPVPHPCSSPVCTGTPQARQGPGGSPDRSGLDIPGNPASLVDVYGRWLSRQRWTWYVTLTFRRPCRRDTLRYVRSLLQYLAEYAWRHPLEPATSYTVEAWAGEEYHQDGERLHVHCLIRYPLDAYPPQRRTIWRWWWRAYGRSRVTAYDPRYGAAYYVGKYVLKDLARYGRYQLLRATSTGPREQLLKPRKSGLQLYLDELYSDSEGRNER